MSDAPVITVTPIRTRDDFDAIRRLVRAFFAEASKFDPNAGKASTFAGLDAELANLPGRYGPPGGVFMLARVDDLAVGCGAFFDLGEDAVEIKRMYLMPQARGMSIGRRIVEELLNHARALGNTRVALSTFYKLEAAQALYQRMGFLRVAPTEDLPPGYQDKVIFFERAL